MTETASSVPADEKEAPNRHRWIFYYDGNCGFCTKVARLLSRIDIFRQVTWVPFQSLDEPPPGLSWEDLDCAAYLSTGKGRLHEGFHGFKMLTLRLLLLVPLAPLFWFPGINLLGVPVYRWIAKNRYRFSACLIQPPKTGQDFSSSDSGERQSTDHPSESP